MKKKRGGVILTTSEVGRRSSSGVCPPPQRVRSGGRGNYGPAAMPRSTSWALEGTYLLLLRPIPLSHAAEADRPRRHPARRRQRRSHCRGALPARRRAHDPLPCLRALPARHDQRSDLAGHVRLFLVAAAAFLCIFLLGVCDIIPAPLALWLVIPVAVIVWVAATVIGARNFNASIRANKALAERLVEQKRLQAAQRRTLSALTGRARLSSRPAAASGWSSLFWARPSSSCRGPRCCGWAAAGP